eukprot:SAG22_NODE_8093_length_684_cov_0.415385_1_plen_61_part_10
MEFPTFADWNRYCNLYLSKIVATIVGNSKILWEFVVGKPGFFGNPDQRLLQMAEAAYVDYG